MEIVTKTMPVTKKKGPVQYSFVIFHCVVLTGMSRKCLCKCETGEHFHIFCKILNHNKEINTVNSTYLPRQVPQFASY